MRNICVLLAAAALLCAPAWADEVHLVDGRVYQVSRWWVDGDYLVMITPRGEVRVLRQQVQKIDVTGIPGDVPGAQTVRPSSFREGIDLLTMLPEERRFAVPSAVLAHAEKGNIAAALAGLENPAPDTGDYAFTSDFILLKSALSLRAGLFPQAKSLLAPYTQAHPRDGYARFLQGQTAYFQGRWSEALEHFRAAMLLFSGSADPAIQSRITSRLVELESEYRGAGAESDNFVFRSTAQVGGKAGARALEILEDLLGPLSAALAAQPQGKIAVVAAAAPAAGPDQTRREGAYDGRIIVSAAALGSPNLERVLAHELVHALLLSRTRGNCPTWLHEGLAQFLSGVSTADFYGELKAALDAGEDLGLYLDSLTLLEYIVRSQSAVRVNHLLSLLASGADPDKAVATAFGWSLQELREQRDGWLDALLARVN